MEACGFHTNYKKIISNRQNPVAQNCPSREKDLFQVLTRLMMSNQPQETIHEKQTSVQAEQETRLLKRNQSEFFERLAFLVTFWAMQKVTRITMAERPSRYAKKKPRFHGASWS